MRIENMDVLTPTSYIDHDLGLGQRVHHLLPTTAMFWLMSSTLRNTNCTMIVICEYCWLYFV
jgi:hypothetical protein